MIQFGFAFSLSHFEITKNLTYSRILKIAQIFVPLGFFLGGFGFADQDPGIGIFLTPIGSLLLIIVPIGVFFSIKEST